MEHGLFTVIPAQSNICTLASSIFKATQNYLGIDWGMCLTKKAKMSSGLTYLRIGKPPKTKKIIP